MGVFNGLTEKFKKSDLFRQAVAEVEEAEFQEHRLGPRAAIQAVREERNERLPALQQRARELRAEERRLRAEWKAAVAAADRAENEAHAAAMSLEQRVQALETELRITSDPRIEKARTQLLDEHARTRKLDVERAYYGKQNRLGEWPVVTNKASIEARLEGLVQAFRALDRLKTEALRPDEVEARIAEIVDSVPEIVSAESLIPDGAEEVVIPIAPPPDPVDQEAILRQRYGTPR